MQGIGMPLCDLSNIKKKGWYMNPDIKVSSGYPTSRGFSMVFISFCVMSEAIVCPICLKSVDKVVIPPANISLSGVSL